MTLLVEQTVDLKMKILVLNQFEASCGKFGEVQTESMFEIFHGEKRLVCDQHCFALHPPITSCP